MSRRTIADASSQVEAMADLVPRAVHEHLLEEVNRARQSAHEAAERAHQTRTDHAEDLAARLGSDLAAATAQVKQLASRAELAEDTAASIASELADQQRVRRQLLRQVDEIGRVIDQLRDIEQDPVGWVDATLYAKYPMIRPEFSF